MGLLSSRSILYRYFTPCAAPPRKMTSYPMISTALSMPHVLLDDMRNVFVAERAYLLNCWTRVEEYTA